jgi:hypothetical protein
MDGPGGRPFKSQRGVFRLRPPAVNGHKRPARPRPRQSFRGTSRERSMRAGCSLTPCPGSRGKRPHPDSAARSTLPARRAHLDNQAVSRTMAAMTGRFSGRRLRAPGSTTCNGWPRRLESLRPPPQGRPVDSHAIVIAIRQPLHAADRRSMAERGSRDLPPKAFKWNGPRARSFSGGTGFRSRCPAALPVTATPYSWWRRFVLRSFWRRRMEVVHMGALGGRNFRMGNSRRISRAFQPRWGNLSPGGRASASGDRSGRRQARRARRS